MARHFLAAGCWVLVACGVAHLLAHFMMVTSTGDTEAEKQLLEMMRGNPRDMGLGFVRSTFDLLTGFSLAFAVECLGFGILGLVIRRCVPGFPPLLRAVAAVLALVLGAMTVVGFVYWFPGPLSFLLAALLCFVASVATAPRVSA